MKKYCILMAAVAIMASACNVADLEEKGMTGNGPVFTASFENAGTKVYVDSNLETRWTEDDRISIFTTTYNAQYRFDGNTGDDSGTFSEVSSSFNTGNGLPTNYAVYPYNEGTSITTSGEISLNLPSVQNHAANTYGLKANTMVAVTENSSSKSLCFKNLCGYLVVKLYGEGTVKSITLKGNNGEKLAGAAAVSPIYGQAPEVTVSESGTETITLDCGEGVALGKTTETATEFWFVIPPVIFSKGFTVTAINTEGLTMEKSVSSSRTILRNVKNNMSTIECVFSISYKYVDLGLSVNWGTCNIGSVKPEEYGRFFPFGDVGGQVWNGSSWSGGGSKTCGILIDKYCNLKPDYDAAHVIIGGGWHVPTRAQLQELIDNCSTVWTDNYKESGVCGRIFTSNISGYTDRSIFLPATGFMKYNEYLSAGSYGYYLSRTLKDSERSYYLYVSQGNGYGDYKVGVTYHFRYHGYAVRPVCDK